MKCQELRQLLDAYIDGHLSQTEANRCDQHISACNLCAESVAFAGAVDDAAKSLFVAELPESDLWPEIQMRIQDRRDVRSRGWLNRFADLIPQPAFMGSSVALVAAAALLVPVSVNHTSQKGYVPADKSVSYGSVYLAGHEQFAVEQGGMADRASKIVIAAVASRQAATDEESGGRDNIQ